MKKILVALVLIMVVSTASILLLIRYLSPDAPGSVDPASRLRLAQGELVGVQGRHETYAWLGIPYAAPPIDALRWRAPQPPMGWEGLRSANGFGAYCMQIGSAQVSPRFWNWGAPMGSEDCLYLNVWAPRSALADAEPRAVMVWIHGGGNTTGQARPYDPSRLAREQDLIIVTINYRLGALGWFSHAALRDTSDNPLDASGNYGTLDIIAALRWVQDNIGAFGGDPQRVTVFGESAGGRNVVSLLASKPAQGLFHRAIVQSGRTESVSLDQAEQPDLEYPGNSGWVVRQLLVNEGRAQSHADAAKQLATLSSEEISRWLRSTPAADLLGVYPAWTFGMYHLPQLIRDGVVLPEMDFLQVFRDPQHYNAVPVITGTNRDEMKLFMLGDPRLIKLRLGLLPSIVDAQAFARENEYRSGAWTAGAVTDLAETLSTAQGDTVWAYRFDWDEGHDGLLMNAGEVLGASHGLEVPFVFGDLDAGYLPPGIFSDGNRAAAEWLAQRMMGYWGAFARDGVPGRGDNHSAPRWLPWKNNGEDRFMVFDTIAGGGVHMAYDTVRIETLKERLGSDPRYSDAAERCSTYAAMFERTRYWVEDEYRKMGCTSSLSARDGRAANSLTASDDL